VGNGADLVAVADCFLPRLDRPVILILPPFVAARDLAARLVLKKEKLDAVFVETTTHARVLICMHALQAGCDVYAEKPQSLTVAEGRRLVQAVHHYRRVLQTGSQQRSMPINRHANKLVREGAIGKIRTVITCNFQGGKTWVPRDTPDEMPKGLDWDQWCNQTELRPYYQELQFKWSDFTDYDSGGQGWGVTGWGTHSLDQVQCALGTDETGPVEIWPEEAGPKCRITMRYANGILLKLEGKNRGMEDLGAIFVGEKGQIEIKRGDSLLTQRNSGMGLRRSFPTARRSRSRTSRISSSACGRERRPTPTPRRDIGPRPSATWSTSAIGGSPIWKRRGSLSANTFAASQSTEPFNASCAGIPGPSGSSVMRRPTSFSLARGAKATSYRRLRSEA
jgi:predicted dehydrogenase